MIQAGNQGRTLGTEACSLPLLGLAVDDLTRAPDFIDKAASFRITPLPGRIPNCLDRCAQFYIRQTERLVSFAYIQARELGGNHRQINVAACVSIIAGIRTEQDNGLDPNTPRFQVANVLIYERSNLGSRSNHLNIAIILQFKFACKATRNVTRYRQPQSTTLLISAFRELQYARVPRPASGL